MVVGDRSDKRIKVDREDFARSKKKYPDKNMCSYCPKKGRWKKDCSKLVKGKEKYDLTTNIAHSGDEDSDIAPTSSSATCYKDEWVLDFGYTYYICPKRKFYSSLEELGIVIYVGSGTSCKIIGICKV